MRCNSKTDSLGSRGVVCSRWLCGFAGLLLWQSLPVLDASPDRSPWERSVVTIEITRNQYDYQQPWSKRTENYTKSGVVIGPEQVLTTADQLADHTLIRLQRGGRGAWWEGEVEWVDYHVNLAIVRAKEKRFWDGLRPVRFSPKLPIRGEVQVVRWRDGRLENRKAEITRVAVKRGKLTLIDHLHLEIDGEIRSAGWSEPVMFRNQVLGLTVSQDGNTCTVLPATLIRSVMEARRKDDFRGLGFFAFVWQRAENPAIHQWLRPGPEPAGVLVIDAPPIGGNTNVLRPRDLILQVDGFDIDIHGDYRDPEYGPLMLETLASRRHWAGDEIPLKIWRDGQALEVQYRLPKVDFGVELVPQSQFDLEPEYFMVGGLVFQPLIEPYLRSWGADWRRRVPFRLSYYEREKPSDERPSIVVLSLVLPDAYNLGYQDFRYLAVDAINGRKIVRVADVAEALRAPRDGFHIIDFAAGDSFRRLVLDAAGAGEATQRALQRYGIQKDRVIHAD